MVARMVSRSRTWWRRICGTTNVQRQGRKEFAGCNSLVQHRALRLAPMALDYYCARRHCGLLAERRNSSQRRVRHESRARLRNGFERLPASGVAWINGCRVPGSFYVNRGNAIELGMLLSGQRSLQAFHGAELQ